MLLKIEVTGESLWPPASQLNNDDDDGYNMGQNLNEVTSLYIFSTVVPDLPNNILFLQNLPEETSELMLKMLFNQ